MMGFAIDRPRGSGWTQNHSVIVGPWWRQSVKTQNYNFKNGAATLDCLYTTEYIVATVTPGVFCKWLDCLVWDAFWLN
jgi:hypothetical protein